MTQTTQQVDKKAIVGAMATGAVIGATVAGIAGAALANDKTRKVIKNKVDHLAKQAKKSIDQLNDKTEELSDSVQEMSKETKTKAENITNGE